MRLLQQKSRGGFTLAEMMVALGCGSIILAAVMTASVALQRSFAAVEDYSTAEADQLRMLDYIAMDCRRAISGTVTGLTAGTPEVDNGSWINSGGTWSWQHNSSGPLTLILSVPNYYDSNGNPAVPTLDSTSGAIQYANATPAIISYYKSGSSFMRQIGSDPTNATAIATSVADFTVTVQDQSVSTGMVSCSITFSPRFRSLASAAAITGTTIYSRTFLRNAAAR
jgi:prepilin-type N-terminal cleavage/methylation domain-containing protein